MIQPDVVVLSHKGDEHALAVLAALSSKVRPLLVDVGREGVDFTTSLSSAGRVTLRSREGDLYDLTDVPFWWNRRPRFRAHDETLPTYAPAQEIETEQFWTGLWGFAPGGVWCNPPDIPIARNKLRQIFLAKECGLAVPETLWSNDPIQIRDFCTRHGGQVVIKMFEGTERVWEPTRLLTADIMARYENLRFAPSIVQALVPGELEYRVVIFDECNFAVATRVGTSRYPFDTRIDTRSQRERAVLSEGLVASLREFMRRSNLLYAAFDVREDAHGSPVFLEVNPMGQFLYLDRYLDGQILKAFCGFIERHRYSRILIPAEIHSSDRVSPWTGGVGAPYFVTEGDRVTHLY